MSDLDDVGKLHVTFEYPNRVASQKVMAEVMKVRFVGGYHYMRPSGGPRITVITEDKPECRPKLAQARRLMSAKGGFEVTIDDDMLEALRERRRRKALAAARGEMPVRTKDHHPHGAILRSDGTILPRNQG